MIWRTLSNNWYSILVNSTRYGFFHSTKGFKQGDPLSPALFILGDEVLSRSLYNLHYHHQYYGFHIDWKGPQINHLSFADDNIIFTTGRRATLRLIMKILVSYKVVFGQLINKDKSNFLLPDKAFPSTVSRIKDKTGF